MRPDAKDIFIDVYRWHDLNPKKRPARGEDYWNTQRERMKDMWGGGTKEQSDNFRPMLGFLRKNAGRPWDKVWSEIKQHCDHRSIRSHHFMEHVKETVELHPVIIDKIAYYPARSQIKQLLDRDRIAKMDKIESTGNWPRFYVDQHGLLRLAPLRKWNTPKPKPITSIAIGKEEAYHLIDGCWFYIRYEVREERPKRVQFRMPKDGPPIEITEWRGKKSFVYETPDGRVFKTAEEAWKHATGNNLKARFLRRLVERIERPVAFRFVAVKRQLSAKEISKLRLPYARGA